MRFGIHIAFPINLVLTRLITHDLILLRLDGHWLLLWNHIDIDLSRRHGCILLLQLRGHQLALQGLRLLKRSLPQLQLDLQDRLDEPLHV